MARKKSKATIAFNRKHPRKADGSFKKKAGTKRPKRRSTARRRR